MKRTWPWLAWTGGLAAVTFIPGTIPSAVPVVALVVFAIICGLLWKGWS